MDVQQTAYAGDEALDERLAAVQATMRASDVRDLLAGVIAAPEAMDASAWTQLVAPDADSALVAQLAALKAEMAAQLDSGLANGPAPAERLDALRSELDRLKLDAFVVPRTDEHQGEYVPVRADRLRWLSGFSGSAGLAVVLKTRAAIFVDGRYVLQVRNEVDPDRFEPLHVSETPPMDWAGEILDAGQRIGIDPWLHSESSVKRWRRSVEQSGAELVLVDANPIDAIWTAQPAAPIAPVIAHPLRYAGRAASDKRTEVARTLKADAAVLTAPDSIAWLLNVRGGDVPRTPLPLSFALLHRDGLVDLFIDERKLTPGAAKELGNVVTVRPPSEFGTALDKLGADAKSVQVDAATASAAIFERLRRSGARIEEGEDPCALPKACKNDTELAGTRAAHRRDGAALSRFLCWLDREAPSGELDELATADHLARLRQDSDLLRDLSFDTISGAGPNGAITHYRVSPETNRNLTPGELYLVDSGGQYADGTTDVTRTVAVGTPPEGAREHFTRVLKGHIALALLRFPDGTTGSQIDALARAALWQVGLDYDHGTGHGVGSYLGVHEGPQRISKLPNTVPLKPGMIVSNEPGYYAMGLYGIRIENLVAVRACEELDGEKPFYEFETLTLAPIDRRLVDVALLTPQELDWFNAYHARVLAEIGPQLEGEEKSWLEAAVAPL